MFCLIFFCLQIILPSLPTTDVYSTKQTKFETFMKHIILSHYCLNKSFLRTVVYSQFLFFFNAYHIVFNLEFEMGLTFKISNFIGFTSFWKVGEGRNILLALHIWSKSFSILVRFILHGNMITSYLRTGGENLRHLKKKRGGSKCPLFWFLAPLPCRKKSCILKKLNFSLFVFYFINHFTASSRMIAALYSQQSKIRMKKNFNCALITVFSQDDCGLFSFNPLIPLDIYIHSLACCFICRTLII